MGQGCVRSGLWSHSHRRFHSVTLRSTTDAVFPCSRRSHRSLAFAGLLVVCTQSFTSLPPSPPPSLSLSSFSQSTGVCRPPFSRSLLRSSAAPLQRTSIPQMCTWTLTRRPTSRLSQGEEVPKSCVSSLSLSLVSRRDSESARKGLEEDEIKFECACVRVCACVWERRRKKERERAMSSTLHHNSFFRLHSFYEKGAMRRHQEEMGCRAII